MLVDPPADDPGGSDDGDNQQIRPYFQQIGYCQPEQKGAQSQQGAGLHDFGDKFFRWFYGALHLLLSIRFSNFVGIAGHIEALDPKI